MKVDFYKEAHYDAQTRAELDSPNLLPVSYRLEIESKVMRVAKLILATVIFPIGLYQLFHTLVGKFILVPAATPWIMGRSSNYADQKRQEVDLDGEWKYKRITLEVDGYKIDATLIGTAETLENGRWVLYSNGNGEFYEEKLYYSGFKNLLNSLDANGLVFNYPGVGASTGWPSLVAMTKAYRVALTFLQDKEHGLGADEIIGYGHSIGAGIQAIALYTHRLLKDITYVFVKSRSFCSLGKAAGEITIKPLGWFVSFIGWHMSQIASCINLKAPEIILQTANVATYAILDSVKKLVFDDIIPVKATLMQTLFERCVGLNKIFIGIPEKHNEGLRDPTFLAKQIKQFLKR